MEKVDKFVKELRAQGLAANRRFVAEIDDAGFEHSQTNHHDLCAVFVKDAAGKTGHVVWQISGPLHSLFILTADTQLERNIADAFTCAFSRRDDD